MNVTVQNNTLNLFKYGFKELEMKRLQNKNYKYSYICIFIFAVVSDISCSVPIVIMTITEMNVFCMYSD